MQYSTEEEIKWNSWRNCICYPVGIWEYIFVGCKLKFLRISFFVQNSSHTWAPLSFGDVINWITLSEYLFFWKWHIHVSIAFWFQFQSQKVLRNSTESELYILKRRNSMQNISNIKHNSGKLEKMWSQC